MANKLESVSTSKNDTSLSDDDTYSLMVVGIDFGTTYSGYAFSMRADFKRDPLFICQPQAWNAGSRSLCSLKTPTCLLLDKDQQFIAFGYEAETKFADLASDDQHKDYYYFERFKMKLHNAMDLSVDMIIEDISGKPLKAKTVFALSIKALKEHLMEQIRKQDAYMKESEITWVLTVPAIWTDKAKNFMRVCAQEAGIPRSKLLIALEPEAASIYFQYNLQYREKVQKTDVPGQYMVVDLGGGTVDVTVHERGEDGKLKEITRAHGGDCGGESVNEAYMNMWEEIMKLEVPLKNALFEEYLTEYLDMVRDFEMAKRAVKDYIDKINVWVPYDALDAICSSRFSVGITTMLQESSFSGDIIYKHAKMKCNSEIIKNLFQKTFQKVVKILKSIFERSTDANVHHIVLVGGFSECPLIKKAIEDEFPEKKVIVPYESGMAVLFGAVLFGHRPSIIGMRVARYSYGIKADAPFITGTHEEDHLIYIEGIRYCRNLFDCLVKEHEQVSVGGKIQRRYISTKNQKCCCINIFYTLNDNPKYTDDNECVLLGKVNVNIPPPHDVEHKLDVEVIFGKTELQVMVSEESGENCKATFDIT